MTEEMLCRVVSVLMDSRTDAMELNKDGIYDGKIEYINSLLSKLEEMRNTGEFKNI